jgi:hypothetical protein
MPRGAKYADLTRYLEYCGQEEVELTFEQVANIVGGLPPSAYKYPASWSNGDGSPSFCYGWLNAGFTAHVDFEKQLATFSKGEPTKGRNSYQSTRNNTLLSIDMAIASIRKYHTTTTEGVHTRYRSWEHCYKAFRENRDNPDKVDYLCLHLACYLASWGMLRNSFLLNRDYLVHMPATKIILSAKYDVLFTDEHTPGMIPLIMDAADEIEKSYGDNHVTGTLKTKILLGSFGCVPAYDRYFGNAASKYGICGSKWGENSLRDVWRYYEEYRDLFEKLRHEISMDGFFYPPMKLMDMCLWQIGFDEDPKSK